MVLYRNETLINLENTPPGYERTWELGMRACAFKLCPARQQVVSTEQELACLRIV